MSQNDQNQILFNNIKGRNEINTFYDAVRNEINTFKVEYEVYSDILQEFLSTYTIEDKKNHHPRLNILSPIEARTLNFDTIIISNLNEGEFGKQAPSQNWLSRKMRLDFGLHDLSRDQGIGSFDFSNYLGNKNIYLTRSLSVNNELSEKSKQLLKLQTVMKAANIRDVSENNDYWNFLLKNFNGAINEKTNYKEKSVACPPKKIALTKFLLLILENGCVIHIISTPKEY